jgi:hypothetical protein
VREVKLSLPLPFAPRVYRAVALCYKGGKDYENEAMYQALASEADRELEQIQVEAERTRVAEALVGLNVTEDMVAEVQEAHSKGQPTPLGSVGKQIAALL